MTPSLSFQRAVSTGTRPYKMEEAPQWSHTFPYFFLCNIPKSPYYIGARTRSRVNKFSWWLTDTCWYGGLTLMFSIWLNGGLYLLSTYMAALSLWMIEPRRTYCCITAKSVACVFFGTSWSTPKLASTSYILKKIRCGTWCPTLCFLRLIKDSSKNLIHTKPNRWDKPICTTRPGPPSKTGLLSICRLQIPLRKLFQSSQVYRSIRTFFLEDGEVLL